MKQLICVCMAAIACAVSATDYSAWLKSQELAFDRYTGAELTNFPVLVVLDPGAGQGFDYASAKPDGTDLRFVDADGSELSYEIDTWNPSGLSYVWVRLPLLNSASLVRLYFGNQNVSAMGYTTDGSTWDADYIAVWHMNLNANNRVSDSTAFAHHLTNSTSPMTSVAGTLGVAVAGSGNTQFLKTGTSLSNLSVDKNLTIEIWAKDNSISSDSVRALIGKRSGASDSSYNLFRYDNQNFYQDLVRTDQGNHRMVFAGTAPAAGIMSYHATTFDADLPESTRATFWRNGTAIANGAAGGGVPTAINKNSSAVTVGALDTGATTATWKGTIDEVRLSKTARSAAWLAASQLAAQNALVSYGPVVGNGSLVIESPTVVEQMDNRAVLSAALMALGSGTVVVTNCYGTSPEALSAFQDCGNYVQYGMVESELTGLNYATTYYYQFTATDDSGTTDQTETASFTTRGEVTFVPSIATFAGNGLAISAGLADRGLTSPEGSPVSVTFYFGTSPETWEPLEVLNDLTAPCTLPFNVANLFDRTTYYWSFRATATMPAPDGRVLTFYSVTNQMEFISGIVNTWQGVANGAWADPANWSAGAVPTIADTAQFNSNPALEGRTIAFDQSAAVQHLQFSSAAGRYFFTSGPALRLTHGGSIESAGTAGQIFNTPILLEGDALFSGNTAGSSMRLAFSNTVSAAGTFGTNTLRLTGNGSAVDVLDGKISDSAVGAALKIVKDGSGLWQLSGTNTFSGGVTVNNGRIRIKSPSALGTGTLTINGGGLSSGASQRLNNPVQIWNGNFEVSYDSATLLNMGAGPVTLSRSLSITLPSGIWGADWTVGGVITAASPDAVLSIISPPDNPGRFAIAGGDHFIPGGLVVSNAGLTFAHQRCLAGVPLSVYNSPTFCVGSSMVGVPLLDVPEMRLYQSLSLSATAGAINFGLTPVKLLSSAPIIGVDNGNATFSGPFLDEAPGGAELLLRQAGAYGSTLHMGGANNVRKLRLQPGTASTAKFHLSHPYAWGNDEVFIEPRSGAATTPVINNAAAAAYTIATTNRFTWAQSFTFGNAGQDMTIANGSVKLATNLILTVEAAARTLTVQAPIADDQVMPRALQKNGLGTLVLGGKNSYKGGTVANGGVLRVTSAEALARGKLTIPATGKVDIPANTDVIVRELVVDGVSYKAAGRYTAAQFPSAITGAGALRIDGMFIGIY